MTPPTDVDVILPVLNEAEALPRVVPRLPSGFHAIVVDNGSTDGSAAVARALGVDVVTELQRGFGAACFAGLMAARAPVVCFMDGDGSLDAADLTRVARPVLDGEADLALGARRPSTGAMPLHAVAGNRLLARAVRRRTGTALTDLGPMRAARREALVGLGIEDRRCGWPLEMVLLAAQAGWRIVEVPVGYRPRVGGRSKVTGTIGGTLRAVRDMMGVLR